MKKKGQFYLAAALIIIVLILSFAGISNYIGKRENVKIYDLKEELGIESSQVLDHGVYNEFNDSQINNLLGNFTETYSNYVETGLDLYFVFGNSDQLVIAGFTDLVTGTISYNSGESSSSSLTITKGVYNATFIDRPEKNEKIKVKVDKMDYEFDLNEFGQTFYFVISQKTKGGDIYVEKG